ncbi:hypothetical protein IJ00_18950 [Calothrix sp. 336/3]|nr:hypothetical protein IJ00_18950 [Calothrix sp. 336/3]
MILFAACANVTPFFFQKMTETNNPSQIIYASLLINCQFSKRQDKFQKTSPKYLESMKNIL